MNLEEIKKIKTIKKLYCPKITKTQANKLYKKWKVAVQTVKEFK